jgi:hypothetical protein
MPIREKNQLRSGVAQVSAASRASRMDSGFRLESCNEVHEATILPAIARSYVISSWYPLSGWGVLITLVFQSNDGAGNGNTGRTLEGAGWHNGIRKRHNGAQRLAKSDASSSTAA